MGAGASQDSGKQNQQQQSSHEHHDDSQRATDSHQEGSAARPKSDTQPQQTGPGNMADDQPQVHNTQRDGPAQQHATASAKVAAVAAMNNPPPKQHSAPTNGKTQEELDEEEWAREKERLSQRLREKRERELREREHQQQQQQQQGQPPPAGSPSKPPAGDGKVPPSSTNPPKKKKLLNGTNIEYRYPSGSVYVGGFKDGKLHGYGKYRYHPSGDRYEGEWIADMKHGQGTYAYDCGDKYTGEWRAGKKHGKGTYSFASGDEYIGNWKEDKIHGHGVFNIARNGNKYEGAWVESYRHGYGVLSCGNGDVYMGNWTKGKEDGQGVLTYANGNIYAGDWKTGQMDGKGILMEDGQKFTVEHISGYLIAKVPVESDGQVDPDWNAANKLYMQHVQKLEDERMGKGSGGGAGDVEALTKMKLERDMWEKKYNDLLASRGGGTGGEGEEGDDDGLDLNDHAAVRIRIGELKEQRELQARRADEAEQKAKQVESHFSELEFDNKHLKEELQQAQVARGGYAGSDAATAELTKMQRRVADLERELAARKQASTTGNRTTNDPLELKAQLELMEGEVRHLRSTREELQRQRQTNLEAQQSIMNLEQKNEELLKEINVVRQRASHSTAEVSEDARRQMEMQKEELKELRAELQDQKVVALTAEEKYNKSKNKLREAEEKALRVSDLEAQLHALKNTKKNQNDAIEKRSDELDSLRAKNAELMRQLEEIEGQPNNAAAAAGGAVANNAALQTQLKELQAKVESQHSDYKKEKKKHKKAAAERDELQTKVAALTQECERAKRVAAAAEGAVTAVVRVRPPLANETQRSVVDVQGPTTVKVNGEQYSGFASCVSPDQINNMDLALEDLRPTARAVAQGFNGCVLTMGPMSAGKSHFCSNAAKLLLQDVFKAVDDATRPEGRAHSYTASYSASCVEINCDGIFDLNNSGSTGSDIRPMRDTFGSVVLDGVVTVPCQLARDAAVDYIAAVGRRRRPRSHVIYTLHVTLRHKVSEAVLRGKFTIADLAGSGGLGDQEDVEAAKYVNNSMIALSQVVSALESNKGETGVPYREDPLTTVLADALGGNCRLAVVCAVGPSENDAETAAQALSVAQRLTKVECQPITQLETSEYGRLRQMVAELQSPEAAEPVLRDIDSLRQ